MPGMTGHDRHDGNDFPVAAGLLGMAMSAAERMRATRARRKAMREAELAPKAHQSSMAELVEAFPMAASEKARGRHRQYLAVLETRFPAPLGVLAAIYATPTEDLAKQLGCTKLEAHRERRAAAEASAPYWHQKQAIAIDTGPPVMAPSLIVLGTSFESEPDQGLIEGDPS
jgi:hypothetical protein